MQMLSKFAAVWFAISTALALPACKLVTSHSSVKSESKAPETGHVTCPTEGFSDICLSYENGTCAWTRCNYGKESGETEPCNYQNRSNFNSCLVNSTPTCESCGGIAASKFAPTDGVMDRSCQRLIQTLT
ncbi:MAG: hypothetical protein NTV34_19780 [Proteobacteria bacterium]|nr:hypothetical protein [Pseudomonadota bacterium]